MRSPRNYSVFVAFRPFGKIFGVRKARAVDLTSGYAGFSLQAVQLDMRNS